ncbi:MAG: (Fe-S)-binding protein [Deferribacteres bacterium]|nr:(Fe-S)-binding protein [Deferribacteres bacterium]
MEGVCVKCAKCKAVCPTYRVARREEKSPRGRLHIASLVEEGVFHESFKDALYTCLMCLSCESVCPQQVRVTERIKKAKAVLWRRGRSVWTSRMLNGAASALMPAKFARADTHSSSCKVCAVFLGCVVPLRYPHLAGETVRFLKEMGYNPSIPDGQRCCGHPHEAVGDFDKGRRLAEENTALFKEFPAVITPCSTCSHHLKERCPGLNIVDVAELIVEYADALSVKKAFRGKRVSFHHPCHLCKGQGLGDEMDEALSKIFGENYVKANSRECCGFGGEVSILYPQISKQVGVERIRDLIAGRVEIVATTCPACMLQLEKMAVATSTSLEIRHLVELLEF